MNTVYFCSDGCGAIYSEEDLQCSTGQLCSQCQTYFNGVDIEICEECFKNALAFEDLCKTCKENNED